LDGGSEEEEGRGGDRHANDGILELQIRNLIIKKVTGETRIKEELTTEG